MEKRVGQVHSAVKRARMLFSILATPKLREKLVARLSRGVDHSEEFNAGFPKLDWLAESGEVDARVMRETAESLMSAISDQAVLEVPRMSEMPSREDERIELSRRIVEIVFERVGRGDVLSEPELNAGIAMLCPDYALVRRDAVDSGLLGRSSDGARYSIRPTLCPIT